MGNSATLREAKERFKQVLIIIGIIINEPRSAVLWGSIFGFGGFWVNEYGTYNTYSEAEQGLMKITGSKI